MKKVMILSAVLLAGISFQSCSKSINDRPDSVSQMGIDRRSDKTTVRLSPQPDARADKITENARNDDLGSQVTSTNPEPDGSPSPPEITVSESEAAEKPVPMTSHEGCNNAGAAAQQPGDVKGPIKKEASNIPEFSTLPPPDKATIGECMGKVTILGEYTEVEEKELVSEATSKTITVPAEYREVEEDITVKDAGTKIVKLPATYKTIEEEVVVTPETRKTVIIPAKYKDVTERVLVHPARKEWKAADKEGKIMKLVMEPEEYKDMKKQVVVEKERTEIQITPAVTKKVKKQVVDQPERTEKQIIPAITRKIKKQVLVSDAATKTIEIPAKYRTEKRRKALSPDREEWCAVLCDENATHDLVRRLQGALIAKGYDLHAADGILGAATKKAVADYQRSLGYESPAIVFKTLVSLGIK